MAIIDDLLVGIPEPHASAYREMWRDRHPWGIGQRPALVIVDMLKGFVEGGSLPFPKSEQGTTCAKANQRLLSVFRNLGLPVYYTDMIDYKRAPELGGWLRGVRADEYPYGGGPGDLEVTESLKPRPTEIVVTKPKPSAFFGTQLASMLIYEQVDTVVATGGGVGRCLRATVEDAFAYNFRVLVPIECVMGGQRLSQQVELIDMGVHPEVVADLVTLDDLIGELTARDAAHPAYQAQAQA